MPLSRFSPDNYSDLLEQKQQHLQQLLAPFYTGDLCVFASATEHFRMRAEFKFWHDGNTEAYYAMFAQGQPDLPVRIDHFPIAHQRINALMPPLREAIVQSSVLKERLFQVEFLTGLSGDSLVTLVYHKALDEQWQTAAKTLEQQLNTQIVGRSRKQKIILSRDYIEETLQINGKPYHYHQAEGSFTQPNAKINQCMISWVQQTVGNNPQTDFLELYCGNGNFTIPLAQHFRQVLATEISKTSVASAQLNLTSNAVDNCKIIRLSSEEFTQALNGERSFRRLQQQDVDLESYNFSTVLVDPPRAGLDEGTLALLSRFDQIVYVSCNPNTLVDNLKTLEKTHQVESAALFDQFPYTDHIEAGIFLKKRVLL